MRDAAAGYFFDVMTNGFGAMQDYAAQVPVRIGGRSPLTSERCSSA
jgi:hypothetical protein